MAEFTVEVKKFTDDTWAIKAVTDSYPAACTAAQLRSHGRAYRVVDMETGKILTHGESVPAVKASTVHESSGLLFR